VQPPYNLLHRPGESDLLPYCQAHDLGVLVYSPLQKGLLSGKYRGDETFTDLRKNDRDFQGERFRAISERVRGLGPIAEKHGLSIVQLILAATLMHPAITCAISGIKRAEQIEEAAGAIGKTISREDWHAVRTALSV
jgi:aryl-alcohol dehydrogenase-like predicted oxidoreductase